MTAILQGRCKRLTGNGNNTGKEEYLLRKFDRFGMQKILGRGFADVKDPTEYNGKFESYVEVNNSQD